MANIATGYLEIIFDKNSDNIEFFYDIDALLGSASILKNNPRAGKRRFRTRGRTKRLVWKRRNDG